MGQRSKVAQLPKAFREMLDQLIADHNFARYDDVARAMNERLKDAGVQVTISKSGAHRYGSNLEKKLDAIRSSTAAAAMIAKSAPDDADLRSAAVMSMLQTEIFNVLVNAQQLNDERDPAKRMKLLSSLSANVAKLSRASVHQKKHELEIRSKAEAAADKVARLAKKGGLTAGTVDEIRREILGIGK